MNIFHFITDRSYIKEEQKQKQKRERTKLNWLKIFSWPR